MIDGNTDACNKYHEQLEKTEQLEEESLERFHLGIEDDVREATARIRAIKVWGYDCQVHEDDIKDAIAECM
jgi:hypothetical protein